MMRYTIVLLWIMSQAVSSWAQDSLWLGQPSVALVPQYLIQQAIRIDVERSLGQNAINRLTLSPYLYAGKTARYEQSINLPSGQETPDDHNQTRVSGWGAEVLIKRPLRSANRASSNIYLAYGAGYHRINLAYQAYAPVPFVEDNLTLYQFGFSEQEENIQRLDVIGLVGLKSYTQRKLVFFDFFAGPVLKKSRINHAAGISLDHDNIFAHGFDGVTYRVGASVGVMLF